MQTRCPFCSDVFVTATGGVLTCPKCGRELIEVSSFDPTAAVCASHPQRAASSTCERCGTFVCSVCLDHGAHTKCPLCLALEGDFKPTPWEQRRQIGLVSGFYRTWTQSVFSPTEFFRKTNPKGSIIDPILFSCIVSLLCGAILVVMRIFGLEGSTNRSLIVIMHFFGKYPPAWLTSTSSLSDEIGTAIVMPFVEPIFIFLLASFVHLGCLIFGARRNGFNGTARAIGYSCLTLYPISALLSSIPFVTLALSLFQHVHMAIGVAQLQKTSGWRATASVLWWYVPSVAMVRLLYGVFTHHS